MARSIGVIQQEMLDSIAADENLAGLNSQSKVSIYRLIVFIVAFSIWVLENLFDTHKKEVDDIIEAKMPHRPSWYRTKAKAFQYGFALIADTDKYDNTGYTDDQVLVSKIIKYAAVTPSAGQILIKIATEAAGVLAPITPEQKASFDAYILEIADCGVKYIVVNHLPDILLLNLQIFRDPLVLDSNGMSIINGNYPVQDAINEYMKELPFNGELVLAHFIDKLQKAEGVVIPHIINAESQAIDINTNEYLDAEPINVKTVPVSGYFTIPNFDNVSYVV
ncbi:MAG: nucleotidyltransferase [Flavobacterium sp.]|uniref:nucleotidyltransferase n=1 Tax=Flavobacterium sp. TaxID=239 RepID=UPI002734E433|nr:nucleotidyltransferase [Flavobacterium sp.]MDP3679781.1 nucleotidyltransferase [Flavobacterium sp.]MDZ4331623.1 nucleotidyltransferase [Flavobacterium sp.]